MQCSYANPRSIPAALISLSSDSSCISKHSSFDFISFISSKPRAKRPLHFSEYYSLDLLLFKNSEDVLMRDLSKNCFTLARNRSTVAYNCQAVLQARKV